MLDTSYLDPIREAFGEHQGLNADWNCMAWHAKGNLYILDDESPDKTLSVVRRVEQEDGSCEIVEVSNGTAEDALAVVRGLEK